MKEGTFRGRFKSTPGELLTLCIIQGICRRMSRFFVTFFILMTFTAVPARAAEVRVVNGGVQAKDLSFLQAVADDSLLAFEEAFGPFSGSVTVVYGATPCLHLGYNFDLKQVQLCRSEKVIDAGSESVDVIHHELFHAMLCAWKPSVCSPEFLKSGDAKALHEGLADFFAYSLVPDEVFGENFSREKPYLRKYRTYVCYSLVTGAHGKSSAIVNALISSGRSLSALRDFFEGSSFAIAALLNARMGSARSSANNGLAACFRPAPDAPAIFAKPGEGISSRLNRYKINSNRSFEITFTVNPALIERYPDFEIRWNLENGGTSNAFIFVENTFDRFHFTVIPFAADAEKIIAVFYSRGKVVGESAFYFTDLRSIRVD